MSSCKTAIKNFRRYVANNYSPFPVMLVRGEGSWVWDSEGKKYLDLFGGYAVQNFGHRHPRIMEALTKQLGKITLTSGLFYSENAGEFAKMLAELSGLDKVLLSANTGAEAFEKSVKIARRWGYARKGICDDRAEIIVCRDNFHGRTGLALAASTVEKYRRGFGPFAPRFVRIPFGDAQALKNAITEHTAAFIVEPIQGEGGVNLPPRGYLSESQEICRRSNILLVLDEIQTGMGRTGKNFCFMHELETPPDMLLVGKGLGAGFAKVAAVAAKQNVMDVIGPGDDGSTFGGDPLGCAVAIEAMKILTEEDLARKAALMGADLKGAIYAIRGGPRVKEIRGKGLLIGMELAVGSAKEFCKHMLKYGVMAGYAHKRVVRISPPLNMTSGEFTFGVDAIKKALKTF